MVISTVPRRESEVLALDWPEFLDYMRDHWKPGDHFSLSALTGAGKSTFMGGLLSIRKYVLALDAKGGDEILDELGWTRIEKWPGARGLARMMERNERDRPPKPNRFIVGSRVGRFADRPALKAQLTRAIEDAFEMGGWTLYIDELQIAADRRMMDLDDLIAALLVSARQPKRITVCSSFQAPSWVSTEAIRQPVWFGVSQTRDEAMVERLAEVMGRDFHELRGAMWGLDPHCFIVVDRNPYSPLIVTQPRRIR